MSNTPASPDPLIDKLPTAEVIRDRLSAILREATTLRRLLRIVEQAEKVSTKGLDQQAQKKGGDR